MSTIATLVMAGIALDLSAGPVTGGQYLLAEEYRFYPPLHDGYTLDLAIELIDRQFRSCATCFFRLGSSVGFRHLTASDQQNSDIIRARKSLATSSVYAVFASRATDDLELSAHAGLQWCVGRLDTYDVRASIEPLQFCWGPTAALRIAVRITTNAWIFAQPSGWFIVEAKRPEGVSIDGALSFGARWQW